MSDPAVAQSKALQAAYNHLNNELFTPPLVPCMLTFSRNANVIGGYYSPRQWGKEEDGNQPAVVLAEIAVNINLMSQRTLLQLYITLAHEMVHHWQFIFGTPAPMSEGHNDEWSLKAYEIGLLPFGPNGETTGPLIDTKLIEGSKLERVLREMPEEAILPWSAAELHLPDAPGGGSGTGSGRPATDGAAKPKPRGTRSKYSCPICGMNAWAKPGLGLMCGRDSKFLVEQV